MCPCDEFHNVQDRTNLSLDWCTHAIVPEVAPGVGCSSPGIYQWTIDGVGIYIGKYSNIRRPLKEYQRNVKRLLNGLHYRKGKPDKFRVIHCALAEAVRTNRKITLTILENQPREKLHGREKDLIREMKPILNR